jgi:inner membrane protease ATP23
MELQITCQKCGNDGPEGGARAFVKGPDPLSIVLCSNRLSSKEEINEVLVHELIHVYDVHQRQWDLTNCYILAKSEVRAAREAECAGATMSFTKRYCAKEKARVATKNMFPDVGLQCVAAVFEEAMLDKAPFGNGKNDGGISSDSKEVQYVHDFGRSFESTYPSDDRHGD